MKNYMRSLVILAALLFGAVSEVWADDVNPNNIIIRILPNNSAGSVSKSVNGRMVTLTVSPATGFTTNKGLITAEKMINAANFTPRRTPRLSDLFSITQNENVYTFEVTDGYDGAYVTVTFVPTESTATLITSLSEIKSSTGNYKLAADISGGEVAASAKTFSGTLDGNGHKIYNLSTPIFNSLSGTVKNLMLDNINVSDINGGNGNVGAITKEANGSARIYNCGILASNSTIAIDENGYTEITSCSSTISGSNYVGGLVGLLDGEARVINCFSYAKVSGGAEVGGIVGHNNVETTSSNLKTMVMNCMFYGEVSGTSIAPIYNGEIITNDGDANGVNNFNYFRQEASYVRNIDTTKDKYNCALAAETRFLQRFEFFRHLLNSNRELAAWWACTSTTPSPNVTKDDMMKWVLEPTQIGTTIPYPILKTPGKYPSVVNYTPSDEAIDDENEHRNEGRKLTNMGGTGDDAGKLTVTIQMGNGAVYNHPGTGDNEAKITTASLKLTITDKDTAHFNFNYGKVQLPYYNDVGTKNYTGNRVVTGWKIVSITGGTAGSFSTGASNAPADVTYDGDGNLTATPYNFADRNCTDKDLYSVSGRVFNQGAYWDVPEGVSAITIEPYWGKCVYLSDEYWDVTYKNGIGTNANQAGYKEDAMTTAANVLNVGGGEGVRYNSSTFNGQVVFTFIEDAISSQSGTTGLFVGINENTRKGHTVYDYAVVLVGNYHHTTSPNADNSKPYTVTSVDQDGDNEPDYSLMLRFNGRLAFHPVRYDFLNLIGLGMAQKTTGGTGSYNLGIMQPKAWFEVTNTALFRVTQFEYSKSRTKSPYILQGGVIEQWVTQQDNAGDGVSYFHLGGNVWFKEFHRGSHQDNAYKSTPHPPVSVTGGDFDSFYLTGLYQSQATTYDDNAECYINGGRFGLMAGAGMEGIGTSDGKGNITWVIDHADIKEFYGGGINFAKPAIGNIYTSISNSYVDVFCGGPKFGDMNSGKTVTTNAKGCTFGTYFGAGYGGNSYNRYAPSNQNNVMNIKWNTWVTSQYTQSYNPTYGGVSTQIDYQFIPMSNNTQNVARLFVEFVGFSLATTHNVISNLSDCTIKGNFYGGGSLGKVDGNVTSTLDGCTVKGNVFGAGFSASLPPIKVMNKAGFEEEPKYDSDLGTFLEPEWPTYETYTWEYGDNIGINTTRKKIITNANISKDNLGSVSGTVTLTLQGNTKVGTRNGNSLVEGTGDVYGGGDASTVNNEYYPANASTIVTLKGNTEVLGNVYGGGNRGKVSGSAEVRIEE